MPTGKGMFEKKGKTKEVVRMKRIFLRVVSLVVLICWGNVNFLYAVGKPVAEIRTVEGSRNLTFSSGAASYTIIPVLVKNNTRERVKEVRLVLYGYDKKKNMLFESKTVSHWEDDMEAGRWRGSDSSIKEKAVVRQNCRLPDSQYLYSKEFKEKYGKPKYYVVELYVGGNLIDVMAKPKNFFKHSNRSEREERLKEWEGAK